MRRFGIEGTAAPRLAGTHPMHLLPADAHPSDADDPPPPKRRRRVEERTVLEVLHADASVIQVREIRNRGALRAVEVLRFINGQVTTECLLYRPDDVAAVASVVEQMRRATAEHDAQIGAVIWLERLHEALDRRAARAVSQRPPDAP